MHNNRCFNSLRYLLHLLHFYRLHIDVYAHIYTLWYDLCLIGHNRCYFDSVHSVDHIIIDFIFLRT